MRPDNPSEAVDWSAIGNLVHAILVKVRDEPDQFHKAAVARGIDVEQLTAAAITEAVYEAINGPTPPTVS